MALSTTNGVLGFWGFGVLALPSLLTLALKTFLLEAADLPTTAVAEEAWAIVTVLEVVIVVPH